MAIASSTKANLVSRLRYRLADYDSLIDTVILENAITDAISFLAKTTECFIKTESRSLTGNSVTISDVFITVQSVKDMTTTVPSTIRPTDQREYDEMHGKFYCYMVRNDSIYVVKANGTYPATIEVTYSYIPNIASESISEKFVPAVLAYAEYRMRDAERDSSLADRAFAEFSILTGVEIVKRDENTLNLSQQ